MLFWYPALGVYSVGSTIIRTFFHDERILPFSPYVPESPPYWFLHLVEDYTFLVLFCSLSFDIFFSTILLQTLVQWKILNNVLDGVMNSRAETYEERYKLKVGLKKCVDHHNFLIGYVNRVNQLMGHVNLGLLGLVISTYCVVIFAIIKSPMADLLTRVSLLCIYTMQFILFYILPAQLLTNESEKTAELSFASNWDESGSDLKKPYLMMISNSACRPVYISALGFVSMTFINGLQTYKLVFSYYTFLNNVNNKGT
uniref:Uncharacterized protein LOC114339088 n=1 Tax=Diabrotica virgifera virgifera TaxID=50390 RepID=A0A6P7GJY3_DIAVI